MQTLMPLYLLDSLVDLHGNTIRPPVPVQILTAYPQYCRLVAYGTDTFDIGKVFDDSRKSMGVATINYRIMVSDIHQEDNTIHQKFVHRFKHAPVLFNDGVMRFRENRRMFEAYPELDGLPFLDPEYIYMQFIN